MKSGKQSGFALIDVIFVCAIIGVLASISLPRLLLAKQAASSASAIGSMRAISSAQLTFALTCAGGFYAPNLTTLGVPATGSRESFLSGGLTQSNIVVKSGYTFRLEGDPYPSSPSTCNGLSSGASAQGFIAVADPLDPANPLYYGTNASGSIYHHSSSLYAVMPEVGTPPAGQVLR